MATLAEINQQLTTPLGELDRELAREILGITGVVGDAVYNDSEARFDALTAIQCRIARALVYVDWERAKDDHTFINGDGVIINPNDPKQEVIRRLRRLLFENETSNIFDVVYGQSSAPGGVDFIEVEYVVGSDEYD